MTCEEVRNRLVHYLDGQCGEDAGQLALHIDRCRGCREEYEMLRATIRRVREVEIEDPGAEFWRMQREEIVEAVGDRRGEGRAIGDSLLGRRMGRLRGFRFPSFTRRYGPVGSLLLLLLVCVGVFLVGQGDGRRGEARKASLTDLDRDTLDQAYLNGDILPDDLASEELRRFSDRELSTVFWAVTGSFGGPPGGEGEGLVPAGWMEPDIEDEILGLDPEELTRFVELLDRISVRG